MPKTSARLLALLSLLQSRRDWPGPLLADRLGISLRTIRRDVDRLRELGYPIAAIKGPDGGYRLSAGTELPPLLFDDEQAVALILALQTTPGDAAARALTTIRQVLPSRLRHRVKALDVTAVERPSTHPPAVVAGDVLLAVSTAVQAREVLRFDYDQEYRRAEPHHVITWDGRWYLIAWDLDRADWRTFRADRITTLRTPNGPRFTPRELPGGDVATFVTSRFRGEQRIGTVTVAAPAATIAGYTRDGAIEELDAGHCRVTLGSWSWAGLAAAFARYDATLSDATPRELREAFGSVGDRLRAAAGGQPTPASGPEAVAG